MEVRHRSLSANMNRRHQKAAVGGWTQDCRLSRQANGTPTGRGSVAEHRNPKTTSRRLADRLSANPANDSERQKHTSTHAYQRLPAEMHMFVIAYVKGEKKAPSRACPSTLPLLRFPVSLPLLVEMVVAKGVRAAHGKVRRRRLVLRHNRRLEVLGELLADARLGSPARALVVGRRCLLARPP